MKKNKKSSEIKGFPGFFTGDQLWPGRPPITKEQIEHIRKNIIPVKKEKEKDE